MAIQTFLDGTASQLTAYGIASIQRFMSENQMAVFFRNNHFSVIHQHHGQLYLLLTDLGFKNATCVYALCYSFSPP